MTVITKCRIWATPVTRVTVAAKAVSQCGGTSDWMVRAGLMETTMNETKGNAEFTHELTEAELDAVSGGSLATSTTTQALDAIGKALATMAQKQ